MGSDERPAEQPAIQPVSAKRTVQRRPPIERPAAREPQEGFTAVGRVTKPHGTAGEIRVYAFESGAPNLRRGRPVWVAGLQRRVLRMRFDRDEYIVKLDGVNDRDAAEALRGELFEIPDAQVRRNDEESYFLHELIGLEVVTQEGEELGKIIEVLQPGANDVYVVKGPRGELLVPAIADVIYEIDTSTGRMVITPLAGMLDESK